MNVTVSMDATPITRSMRRLYADQIPFATSKALNKTAETFQAVQRQHMHKVFEIRRRTFADRAVKIKPFATKRRLEVQVQIEPPGGKSRADIFSKFEDRGTKKARDGGRLAVPVEARRGKTGVVGKAQRPKAFNFKLRGSGPKGEVWVGDKRTFMIRRPDGSGGIFQRVGRGKSMRTRQLYQFTRSVKIDDRLEFEENVTRTARRVWAREFATAFNQAVRTARV